MVARLLWEQDAAGSSPVTSTKVKPFFELRVIFRGRKLKEGKKKKPKHDASAFFNNADINFSKIY